MLTEVDGRMTIVEEHAERLRRDYLAPRPSLRAAAGRCLVRLGTVLAGDAAFGPAPRVRPRLRPSGSE